MDERIVLHLRGSDEIWHAGDIGTLTILEPLKALAPLRVVYGNIDGVEARKSFEETTWFEVEGLKVLMTHIAGPVGKYNPSLRTTLASAPVDLLVCGHSHILKVMRDPAFNLLYMNPGAAGRSGFHKVRTLLRFEINKGVLENASVVELGARSRLP